MAVWLWCFVWYSFLGYLLEKAFAAFTDSPRQTRKGFWLLPLCPVYGLAMLLILWQVPNPDELPLGWLIPVCAVLATMTEYGVDWWYDTFFGVRFWDYSGQAFQLNGRVCLCFSLIWGGACHADPSMDTARLAEPCRTNSAPVELSAFAGADGGHRLQRSNPAPFPRYRTAVLAIV